MKILGTAATPLVWAATGESISKDDAPVWCAYTGQSEEEIRQWGWLDALHPDDREQVMQTLSCAIAAKRTFSTICRLRRYDGAYYPFRVQGIPLLNNDGSLQGWIFLFADVSKQAAIEDEDQENRQLYRTVFEQATVGIVCLALDGHILRANQQFCRITGYAQEELAALSMWDLAFSEDLESSFQIGYDLLIGQAPARTLRRRFMRKDGTTLWVRLTVALMRTPSDEPAYFVFIFEDISEHVAAEEEHARLLEREQAARMEAVARTQQLEAIFESMADGVLVFDAEGNIIQSNTALRKLLQMDRFVESFKLPLHQRVNLFELRDEDGQPLPEDQWPIMRILHGESLQGKNAVDTLTHQLDGRDLLLNQAGAPVRDQDNRIIGGVLVFRDVTERRQLERRIKKAFTTLLTLAEEVVRIPDEIGKLSPEEQPLNSIRAVGQRLVELTSHVLECRFASITLVEPGSERLILIARVGFPLEDKEWIAQEVEQSTLSDYLEPETIEHLRANEVVIRDVAQAPLVRRSDYNLGNLLIAPMIAGEQLVGVLALEKRSSAQGYTEEEIALAKAIAKLAHLVIERERLQQEWLAARASQLALEETNRRFDEFLGIAGHELRTPLTTIKGNIQLALRRLQALKRQESGDEGTLGSKLEKIDRPLHYAEHRVNVQNRMISDLLDVSRIQAGKFTLVMRSCNLTEIVREAVEDQRYANPDHAIILEISEAVEKAQVIADEDRIGQVIHNYLSNALKYSPVDLPIIVRVEREGEALRVSVQDKGPGLPIEEQKHIWERFYRAKGVKAQNSSGTMGMGLGLHICRTIIEYHHGSVGVQSSPGKGSTFWFSLPLAPRTAPGAHADAT